MSRPTAITFQVSTQSTACECPLANNGVHYADLNQTTALRFYHFFFPSCCYLIVWGPHREISSLLDGDLLEDFDVIC